MDHLLTPHGGPVQVRSQFQFMQSAFKAAIAQILSNRTAVEKGFIISGVNAEETTDGDNVTVTVEDGVICLNGEPVPVPAQSVVRSLTEVAYLVIEEVGVDTTPVLVNGQSVNVKMHRFGKLVVGNSYPSNDDHCKVDAPTMNEINKALLNQERSLQPLDILPTALTTDEIAQWYNPSGMGIPDTPGAGRALCNGLNGTPDLRGLTVVGAVTGVPASGAGLPTIVEKNWEINEVFGEEQHKLLINEMPSHTHEHTRAEGGHGFAGGSEANASTGYQQSNTTPAGGNQPHNNIQPSRALVYVMVL